MTNISSKNIIHRRKKGNFIRFLNIQQHRKRIHCDPNRLPPLRYYVIKLQICIWKIIKPKAVSGHLSGKLLHSKACSFVITGN